MSTVKYYHSNMLNAPKLTGAAGSLLTILKETLCFGFGSKNVSNITVTNGVALVAFDSPHSFEVGTVALIVGCDQASLNGEKLVVATTTMTISFLAINALDGVATGTITAKLAPAGWETDWVPGFIGTNIGVFRSKNPTSCGAFLKVTDTSATNARVVGYESMSDLNTGIGQFPTNTQVNGGCWWPKANAANATARAWTIVADDKTFYLYTNTLSTGTLGLSGSVYGFGDFKSLKSGDPYAAFIQGPIDDRANDGNASSYYIEYCHYSPQPGPFLARSFTSIGGSVAATSGVLETISNVSGASASASSPIFPNGPDNSLIISKKLIIEPNVCRRGVYRGINITPQNCHLYFNWLDKINGQDDLLGRKLLAIKCGAPARGDSAGVMFIDITGPWD